MRIELLMLAAKIIKLKQKQIELLMLGEENRNTSYIGIIDNLSDQINYLNDQLAALAAKENKHGET